MSAARRRKKVAKQGHVGVATGARYNRRYARLESQELFHGVVCWQAPVKYNRCKHCGYRRHCSPDLVDMKIRLGKTGRKIA